MGSLIWWFVVQSVKVFEINANQCNRETVKVPYMISNLLKKIRNERASQNIILFKFYQIKFKRERTFSNAVLCLSDNSHLILLHMYIDHVLLFCDNSLAPAAPNKMCKNQLTTGI